MGRFSGRNPESRACPTSGKEIADAEELERGADLTRSTDFEGLAISGTDHHVLNILNGKSA
jgi:hypothetical protein